MRSKHGGREQIRVGEWVLAKFWKSAYKWIREKRETVPVGELVHWGAAFYVAGPGRVQKMARGMARTWPSWQSRYPQSNITKYVDRVWKTTEEQHPHWDLEKIDDFLERKPDLIAKKNMGGLIMGLLVIAFASLAMRWQDKES